MTNKEKFLALVSEKDTSTLEKSKERIRNREMLRESRAIALKVLSKLDDLGWSKKRLADEMGVKPQQITKIVSGKENLTLKTQIALQRVLDIPILATFIYQESNDVVVKVEEQKKEIEVVFVATSNEKLFYRKTNRSSRYAQKLANPNYTNQLTYAS